MVPEGKTRILIADDFPAIRSGLLGLVGPVEGFAVVGLAGDSLEAVEKTEKLCPDVVITDAQMPNMDGVEATRRIQWPPGLAALFFDVFMDCIEASRDSRADGFLTKDCDLESLMHEARMMAARARRDAEP